MTVSPALLVAIVFAAAGALVPLTLRGRPAWLRAIIKIVFFVGLTATLPLIVRSPFAPHFSPDPEQRLLERFLEAAWWFSASRALVGLLRLVVVVEHRPRETRLVSDLVAGLIYAGMAVAIVNIAFDIPVRGLLATSGIIAIVLGLALQSTMSDVFAGVALGIERPYGVGDELWLEGGIEGRVAQINWRSTHVETGDGDLAIVPNSVVAKAHLINRSYPTTVRQESVSILLNPRAAPARCLEILLDATRSCPRLLAHPAPSASLAALSGDSARYTVAYAVSGGGQIVSARTELLDQIHRHLRFTGIGLAIPSTVPPELGEPAEAVQFLDASKDFESLTPEQRAAIAARMIRREIAAGEVLIEQGANAVSVMLVQSGAFSLTRTSDGITRRIGTLSPANFIGLVGLMLNEPYGVTATALTRATIFEMSGKDLHDVIAEFPQLGEVLLRTARTLRASIIAEVLDGTPTTTERSDQLLDRLRAFFGLGRDAA